MYLPKSKYNGPFTATGGENELLVKENLKPFRGKYIVTYKNQYFEGESPQLAKRELVLKKDYEKSLTKDNETRPIKATIAGPTENDYKNKIYTRYFIKDLRKGKIVEVNDKEFNVSSKLPSHSSIELEWDLSVPADDTYYNGYLYIGSASRNAETVLNAENLMRGIKDKLKDPKQFVV
jgi:hypothetical protein